MEERNESQYSAGEKLVLKPNELRIGNWVKIGFEHILTDVMWHSVSTISIKSATYDSIEPIPLTEQWLIDFGAVKGIVSGMVYGRFKLIWKENYQYWYVVSVEENTYLTKIEFVHEWQSFVFAMDGEELTIK